MAKKVVWSKIARDDFRATLKFYSKRNGNNRYSHQLSHVIELAIEKLYRNNLIGRPCDDKNVRILFVGNFQIYYEVLTEEILILAIWDVRRNPDDLQNYLSWNIQ